MPPSLADRAPKESHETTFKLMQSKIVPVHNPMFEFDRRGFAQGTYARQTDECLEAHGKEFDAPSHLVGRLQESHPMVILIHATVNGTDVTVSNPHFWSVT